MTALPSPPVLGYSFTSFSTNYPALQQPGVYLDAEFNRTNAAVTQLISFLGVSLNPDGTLNTAAVQNAYSAGTGGGGGANIADAPSAASAVLAQAWAEYLPGPLPAETLAGTGIVGSHWSARWWANQALLAASLVPNMLTAKNLQTGVVGLAYPSDGIGGLSNNGAGTLTWVPFLPAAGGTLTGTLVLSANPTLALGAATKQYVDAVQTLANNAQTAANNAQTTANNANTAAGTAIGLATNALPMTGGNLSGNVHQTVQPAAADVSDLVATTAWAASAGALGNTGRNRLHNSCMEVAQRGSGLALGTSAAFQIDRWSCWNTSGTGTIGVYASGGHTSRFQMGIRSVSMAAGQGQGIQQRLEAADSFDLVGKQVTLTFSTAYTISAGATTFQAVLYYPNTTDAWGAPVQIQSVAFTPTGTPNTYTLTFNALPAGVAKGLGLILYATQSGATGTLSWDLTDVRLEAGAKSSPGERRCYADELARCQRYFRTGTFWVTSYMTAGAVFGGSAAISPPMRSAPTFVLSSPVYTNASAGTINGGASYCSYYATATVSGGAVFQGNFTASAEI